MENTGNPLGAFAKEVAFAAEKHRNQRRKDAEASPYINHPIALANVLANEGGVEDVTALCAAVLHDTIEDTETTADELRALFGPKVASVVMEVTDDKSLEKSLRKQRQIAALAKAVRLRGIGERELLSDKHAQMPRIDALCQFSQHCAAW